MIPFTLKSTFLFLLKIHQHDINKELKVEVICCPTECPNGHWPVYSSLEFILPKDGPPSWASWVQLRLELFILGQCQCPTSHADVERRLLKTFDPVAAELAKVYTNIKSFLLEGALKLPLSCLSPEFGLNIFLASINESNFFIFICCGAVAFIQ